MILDPEEMIREKIITHPDLPNDPDVWHEHNYVSPNGIDFTLDKVFHLPRNFGTVYFLGKSKRDLWTPVSTSRTDHVVHTYYTNDDGIQENVVIKNWVEIPPFSLKELDDNIKDTNGFPTVYRDHTFLVGFVDEKKIYGCTVVPPHIIEMLSEQPTVKGWYFMEHVDYDCMSDFYLDLPQGIAATLIIRSSLNRHFVTLTSGLYDSGFKGNIGFILHIGAVDVFIAKGARVGQVVFHQANTKLTYKGYYNTTEGEHWSVRKTFEQSKNINSNDINEQQS